MEYLHLAVAIACNMGWYEKVVHDSAIPFTTDDDFRIRVNNTAHNQRILMGFSVSCSKA